MPDHQIPSKTVNWPTKC